MTRVHVKFRNVRIEHTDEKKEEVVLSVEVCPLTETQAVALDQVFPVLRAQAEELLIKEAVLQAIR